ncbi:MAG TPA: hypothetical protein VFQ30_07870 [Ktedonobacteraceae bacterium]|nr:hypothetical protein [Ktedonobacteraceae bacterium]
MSRQCISAIATGTTSAATSAFVSLPATGDMYGLFCGSGSHDTLLLENVYATLPVLIAQPARAYARPDEEELHTSFEQAISDRVTAINSKLRRITERPATPVCAAPFQAPSGMTNRLLHSFQRWQRRVRLASLALLLLLAGFDLMGLLVLYMH